MRTSLLILALGLSLAGPARAAFDLFAADEVANIAHHVLLERCPPGRCSRRAINRSLTIG